MFDGVVRILSDMRHVLELKRNLISLSILNSKGYRYTTESGVLKISKVVAYSSLLDDDITKIWHIRLGYMSENGMAELSKRGLLNGQGICKLKFCKHCIFGKQKRVRFTRGIYNTKGMLEKIWAFFLKQKSDVFSTFKSWKTMIEKQTGKQIKYLRTYNGLDFYFDEFNKLCKLEGIVRHLTVHHTPQQNDIAERMNITIMKKVRCMLSNANLPKSFWAKAASTACFLINRSPFVAIEKKTPQEEWDGNLANYSDLKIFGCLAYAHVDNGKLEPRSIKYVFLGYTAESTPQASTIIENKVASSPQYSIAKNRTRRDIKPPKKYAKADLVAYALNVAKDIDANQESSNYSEADLVKLPKGKKVVRYKWVFKKKEGTLGVEKPRYKARLVAKGYSQIPRVDFTDVFSPVVKHSSIRALLGIVAMHDLELEQLDVKTVFLYGELEDDIYMQQLEGFTVSEKEDYVCLLKKFLYGLKQSPR
ncbi:hypothetical protein CXB51_035399 [Gossypium anomalum]|uniref:Integrase catalytic domain-containing protein n=1 Tax=Gossypium anomalum TaxID=47600 RepID=A0A8J6CKB1_9ROSI|nr:hypothetical protein CXB51_035399 [Gossypium anomalum]